MRYLLLTLLMAHVYAAPFSGKVESVDGATEVARLVSKEGTVTEARLGAGDLLVGWTGRQVRGDLIESDGKLRLERIFPADPEALRRIAEVTDALRRDTVERGRLAARGKGDLSPAWMLWDQAGRLVSSSDLRGKPVVINYIFTRCGVATMCPAATASMAALAQALRDAGLAGRVHLVSVTFDPAYDSPGVLRAYADGRGLDLAQHRLLTGDARQIKDLMAQSGIQTIQSDGTIVHNAATLIISSEGRIVSRLEGPRFETPDVVAILRAQLDVK